ncbi:hypothetical protein HZH68_005535 [Vespula germanica]|uniref:Uncharacterized protein n=1 Tax=Vespula germanica TaxID=30212 RepID=A0A834KHV6_VESGE|nr:hypothetical protein HZH68_005535 [Vespula germanica]
MVETDAVNKNKYNYVGCYVEPPSFIGWVYKTAEVDLTTLKPGYANETLILCQNIEELTSISIMNDVHGVSVGWLLLAACLVIVSATDYREGVFITLWC